MTDEAEDLEETPKLRVTFSKAVTVQPPAGLTDPAHLRDWFYNHYRQIWRDYCDARDPDDFHVDVLDEAADWWACPACGSETEIVRRRETTTRRCRSCDWTFQLPDGENVDRGEGIETDGGGDSRGELPSDGVVSPSRGRARFDRGGEVSGEGVSSAATDPTVDQPEHPRIQQPNDDETSVCVDLETLDDVDDILTALAADDDVHPSTEVEFHQRGSVSLHWEVQDR